VSVRQTDRHFYSSLLLVGPTRPLQADLLAPRLDLELIGGPELELGGAGLARQQVAVDAEGFRAVVMFRRSLRSYLVET
jgi:hypothetical protein